LASATGGYTLAPGSGGTLTFSNNGLPTSITVASGSHTISAPLTLADNLDLKINGMGLTLSGALNNSSGKTLTKTGPGTLTISGAQSHGSNATLSANAGTTVLNSDAVNLTINANAAVRLGASQHLKALAVANGVTAAMTANGARYLQVQSLTLAPTARLDLNDNDLIVAYGTSPNPFTTLRAWVSGGYSASVNPSRVGIVSSTGQTAGNTILALIDNAAIGATSWPPGSGNPVTANSIIGKFTYFGDVDFDGQVTPGDYGVLDANLGTTPPRGIAWLSGDADLDGSVSPGDYGILDANLGSGSASPLAPASATVPEPAVVIAAPMMLLLKRRRKR
jgi:autotransporter-associated beta strand protein